jgi:hypothetical protein
MIYLAQSLYSSLDKLMSNLFCERMFVVEMDVMEAMNHLEYLSQKWYVLDGYCAAQISQEGNRC